MHTKKPIRPQIGAEPPRRAYCAFLAGQGASFLLGHNFIDHDSSTLKKQVSKLPRTPLVDRSVMADSKPRDYAHFGR